MDIIKPVTEKITAISEKIKAIKDDFLNIMIYSSIN
jgi:hypothetical protein